MASSSHNTFEGNIDKTFDQKFENLCYVYGDQEDERKTRKK